MRAFFRLYGASSARPRGAGPRTLTRVWLSCTTAGSSSSSTVQSVPSAAARTALADTVSCSVSATAAADVHENVPPSRVADVAVDVQSNATNSINVNVNGGSSSNSSDSSNSSKNVMYGINDGDETHPDFQPRIVATDLAEDEVAMIKKDIRDTIQCEDVVVFIKGVPEAPMCAFSKRMIDVMEALGLEYTSFDVLAHPVVRIYVKTLSEWPTIPQLFVKGDFVGGMDIVLKMAESGDLQMFLDSKNIKHRDQQFDRSKK